MTDPASSDLSLGSWPRIAMVWALCCIGLGQMHAQSNWRIKRLVFVQDTTQLDTLSVAPGSLSLVRDGVAVDTALFELDPFTSMLIWKGGLPSDTVMAKYRVLPLLFSRSYFHKDRSRLLTQDGMPPDPFIYRPTTADIDLFGTEGLNKSGSISRGVLFGNNQDLAVNSTLNLELSGKLTDEISVLASITDNNIPIQAGGNTAEIQDFDQVFIKLFTEDQELVAGDFVMRPPKSYFLTYLKKAKGLSFSTRHWLADSTLKSTTFGASASISKGRFAENRIQGIEGVQGPYRLRGSSNETFIVVLSGTERVFMDGELLTRGQDHDYVIDYNIAEVTFTAKRTITKDKRIVVEFQYSDKNYTRSMLHFSNETILGRTAIRLNVLSEQDHKNQPLQQALSDQDELALTEAGDDLFAAAVPGIDSVAFDASEVLYLRIDSLGYFPVFVQSNDPDSAFYRLIFTRVGTGSGDYVQQSFTPNGRVFRWVAPDTVNGNIVQRGDHAPLRILIAPRAHQFVTLNAEHEFSKRTKGMAELAFSNLDQNTFSSIDQSDDQGYGARIKLDHSIPIDTTTAKKWAIATSLDAEGLSENLRQFEDHRPNEFYRDWNAQGVLLEGDQLLAGVSLGPRSSKGEEIRYGFSTFQVQNVVEAYKHQLNVEMRPAEWELDLAASLMNAQLPKRSDFLRHRSRIARRLKWFTIGYKDEHELNEFTSPKADSLVLGSYQFYDWQVFLQSADTFRNKFRVGAGQRYDKTAFAGTLVPQTVASNYTASLELARDPKNRFKTDLTYRRLQILDSTLTSQRPEDTYLSRLDYDLVALKGVAVVDLFYEFGAGLEQKKEFVYVEVPAGQGVYVWIDYNDNGVRELNEFEIASFGYEANYIRVFVPSNEYVNTFSNQFSASLDLRPGVTWAEKKGVRKFVAKFSQLSAFRIDRRTNTKDVGEALVPFLLDPLDTTLLSFSSSVTTNTYYDRTSRKWSLDHSFQNVRNKSFLLNGSESRTKESHKVHGRWNLTRQLTFEAEGLNGRTANGSDLLEGRTFNIEEWSGGPKLTWQPNNTVRTKVQFVYQEKTNRPELGGGGALSRNLGAEFRLSAPGKGSIQFNADLVQIDMDGDPNSPLGNELLVGLKPGTNMTWTVSLQRNLSKNLQIDLTYNGRRSENVPMVHVGGAQVRAFF